MEEPLKRDIIVRRNQRIEWARSATKHRVSRERSKYVIAEATSRFRQEDSRGRDPRFIFLGDDSAGVALEVIAIEMEDGALRVIHAMRLRRKYLDAYEEARDGEGN
jgi:hypothetical protein